MEQKATSGIILTLLLINMLTLAFDIQPIKAEPNPQPPFGMISYWKFDEGTGTTAFDSMNTNHGTVYGATWTTGIVDDALSFDGVDDYVKFPDSNSLDITNAITIEAWIKATVSLTNSEGIVFKSNNLGASPVYGLFFSPTGGIRFQIFTEDVGVFSPMPTDPLPIDEWSHVVGTYEGNIMRIYLDGVEQGSLNVRGSGVLRISNEDVYIGFSSGFQKYFDGIIDEVAIYSRALTVSEVQQHYQNGLMGLGYFEGFIGVGPILWISAPDDVNLVPCNTIALNWIIGNIAEVGVPQLQYVTFTTVIKDNSLVEIVTAPSYIATYEVRDAYGTLMGSGSVYGIFTVELFGFWDPSGIQQYEMVTWHLPNSVVLPSGWRINLSFQIHCEGFGVTTVLLFPRATEDHSPSNIIDWTNLWQEDGVWYPLQRSYDPWDEYIESGHSFRKGWLRYKEGFPYDACTITQTGAPSPHPPMANFTESNHTPQVGEAVYFDGSASEPGFDGDDICPITSYEWNFGDGNITTESDPYIVHVHMNPGLYTVILKVTAPGILPNIHPLYVDWDTESAQKNVIPLPPTAPVYIPSRIKVLMNDGSIKTMNLDEYVKGVIAAEMGLDWPIEALKAQAVAARTFAVKNTHHDHVNVDVCIDPNCCQAWKPQPYNEAVEEAVISTRKVVIIYDGKIVREALFFSHCNGQTRNSEDLPGWRYVPYLRSVPCGCANAYGWSDYYGHGVGMCQYGARVMAEQGYKYIDILKHYYTGVEIVLASTAERWIAARLHSPGELRVYDIQGRVTGVVNGVIKEEIPDSSYDDIANAVTIFSPTNSYRYQVVGTEEGSYNLEVTFVMELETMAFAAINIPTSVNATNQYIIDWDALSAGEEGVTVQIDSDGDGTFEQTITADNELSHDEFVLQTETTIDFDPDTLNLLSSGKWITSYVELPEGYNVTDIDVSTIKLNNTIPAEPKPTEIGDYDNDTIPDLMVKFNRTQVIQYINNAQNGKFRNITLTITGSLTDETPFEGTDTIKTISPDINNDKVIDVIDIVLVVHALGTTPSSGGIPGQWHAWNPNADINRDQIVDAYDLATTTLYYGETVS